MPTFRSSPGRSSAPPRFPRFQESQSRVTLQRRFGVIWCCRSLRLRRLVQTLIDDSSDIGMNHSIGAYSLSGYQLGMGACNSSHIEHEHCPPLMLVMLVFAAAMLGGAWFSHQFESFAAGWIAWVAILAMLGAFVDRRFSGAAALERRIRHRQKARLHALCNMSPASSFRQQWPDWRTSATREWTSTSAYRRHPRPMTTARAGWSPDSTHRGNRAECRIPRV